MQSPDEKTWDAVELNSMFTFERGKEKNITSLTQGRIPLVSARKVNNGVKGFVGNPAKVIKGGNVISLNNDGDGGAGLAYYQPIDFALDTHVTALHPKEDVVSDALLYMTASISKQHAAFGHGRSISLSRAHRIQNMLPVTDSGEPDYAYMAEYAQQKRDTMLAKYRAYVEARIAELGEYVEIPTLDEREWREFPLESIFTVSPGKRLGTRNKVAGNRPFIGAADNNNGVTGFVGNDNASKDSNVLGVNYNGAPCIAFYHPYECIFSDDVKRLHLRSYAGGKFVLLFFTEIFAMQRSKYSYGYKFKERRMLRQKLMIPINDAGEPDYEYMEQYVKNMMLRKYEQYLMFFNNRL